MSVFVKWVEYGEVGDNVIGGEWSLRVPDVNRCAARAAAPKKAKMHESSCLFRPMPPWLNGSVNWSYMCAVMFCR